ncbi:MAG: ATP-binding cassette domain-containing protein, partial [Fibrobacter sp.]|nr:ATP-binding cassette domain-containing protein [Fibrobacter sp.]
RVVMARALLKEPALLILDNPFQGLDTQYTEYFCSTIIPSLQESGVNIILVTNETDRIPDVVSHIFYVDSFRAAASGAVSDVKPYLEKSAETISGSQLTNALKKIAESKKIRKKPKPDTCIKMTNVTVSYGTKKILSNFSWVVKNGENWAVLGANGSGKTTLLSLVLGDHPQAYANSIEVLGKRLGKGANLWDIKKGIGWVSPELQTCYPLNTSCLDVVLSGYFDSIGLFKRCSSQKRKFAKELFSMFNLSHTENWPLGSASEGVQRIVLLMRAIVKMPDILVLDEPCQGIPPNYRKIIFSVIETLAQDGNCTVIFVTHQLNELPLCITNTLNLEQC